MSFPERSAAPRDDRTGWEREAERSDPPYQLCRGTMGDRCDNKAVPGTQHCESCHDYIGGFGTGGT